VASKTLTSASMRWSPEALQAREGAREEERRRLARELHDELSQALTGLKMELSWVENRVEGERSSSATDVHAKVQVMRQLLDRAMHTLRSVITELRPEALDRLGLVAALEWQAETFARKAGLRCRFTSTGEAVELDRGRASSIFRAFQEMLTNVARHAAASRVDVTVAQSTEVFVITVRDNGRGFEAAAAARPSAFGLLGMRERALLLGGEIEITTAIGRGTTVILKVPLANRRTAGRPAV
jgi:two-component system, NarL family, sensor histidine kinase UhpB